MIYSKAWEINTGAVELTRWNYVVLSNKTFAFFFNLIGIGLIGAFFSSRQKKRPARRLAIMLATWGMMALVGLLTSGVVHL